MARELKRVGVVHEFVPIPGGGHGFDRDMTDPRTVGVFKRIIAFLTKVV
jgi:dipeptidyl aminopeptidase/acylaminoacyl peptidase